MLDDLRVRVTRRAHAGRLLTRTFVSYAGFVHSREGHFAPETDRLGATEILLVLQDFVDYGLAAFVHGDDFVERRVAGEGDVDDVVAGIEQDVDG